jgi:hypothetical protein
LDGTPCGAITLVQPARNVEGFVMVRGLHDAIYRNVRFSGAWLPGDPTTNNSGHPEVDGQPKNSAFSYNIYFQRVTMHGAADSGVDLWCGVKDVTLDSVLIYGSFHPSGHGCSSLYNPGEPRARERITYYRVVWSENGERQPQLREGVYDFDLVNVIVHNWQPYGGADSGFGLRIDDDSRVSGVRLLSSAFLPGNNRPTWGCVIGDTPGNDNDAAAAAALWQSDVINPGECSKATAPEPVRPYSLDVVPAAHLASILPTVGVAARSARESELLSAIEAALP